MILVFLANGFEETEAIAPVDILRRCGAKVATVGVGGKTIRSSRGIPVGCDLEESELSSLNSQELEMVVLPGGLPGVDNLWTSPVVQEWVDRAAAEDRFVAAICAGPSILARKGLLDGRRATCYPGFEVGSGAVTYTGEGVVRDGRIITAKGAGMAIEFGLALAAALFGEETAHRVQKEIQCQK